MNRQIPTKFYKYYSVNLNSISNLINKNIYFSHPKNFNDPHDCLGRLMIERFDGFDISSESYEQLVNEIENELRVKLTKTKGEIDRELHEIINK